LGSWHWEDFRLRPIWANSLSDSIFKTVKAKWTGSVHFGLNSSALALQAWSPEFKPQNPKRTQIYICLVCSYKN
jgi:hypothetical protein